MQNSRLTVFHDNRNAWPSVVARRGALLLALLLTISIFVVKDEIGRLGIYGYPAIFLTSLVSSATLFFPAPSIALMLTFGQATNPVALGLTAGLGSALGELSGYFVGYSGKSALGEHSLVLTIEQWMNRASDLVIFSMALIPNPLVDVAGIVAGISRVPIWRFILVIWLGRSLRYAFLATLFAMIN